VHPFWQFQQTCGSDLVEDSYPFVRNHRSGSILSFLLFFGVLPLLFCYCTSQSAIPENLPYPTNPYFGYSSPAFLHPFFRYFFSGSTPAFPVTADQMANFYELPSFRSNHSSTLIPGDNDNVTHKFIKQTQETKPSKYFNNSLSKFIKPPDNTDYDVFPNTTIPKQNDTNPTIIPDLNDTSTTIIPDLNNTSPTIIPDLNDEIFPNLDDKPPDPVAHVSPGGARSDPDSNLKQEDLEKDKEKEDVSPESVDDVESILIVENHVQKTFDRVFGELDELLMQVTTEGNQNGSKKGANSSKLEIVIDPMAKRISREEMMMSMEGGREADRAKKKCWKNGCRNDGREYSK